MPVALYEPAHAPKPEFKLSDQTSPAINYYFHRDKSTTALTNPVAIGATSATLNSVAGIVVGDYLYFFQPDGSWVSAFHVVNLPGGNVVDLDMPFDLAYAAGSVVIVSTHELNVNGSVTPVVHHITPLINNPIDITQVRIAITCAGDPDDSMFGDIVGGLANGIQFRKVTNGVYTNIGSIKTNGMLGLFGQIEYHDKAGGGAFGVRVRIYLAGQQNRGVVIRVNYGDEVQLVVQDNLTTLTSFNAIITGHLTD